MLQLAHYNTQPHPTPRVYHPGRRGCHREPPHKLLDSCYRVLVVTAPHLSQATHVQQLGKRRQQLEGTLLHLAQHTGPRVNHAVPHLNGNVQAVMTHILPVHHRPAVHLRLQAGEQLLHKDLMRTLGQVPNGAIGTTHMHRVRKCLAGCVLQIEYRPWLKVSSRPQVLVEVPADDGDGHLPEQDVATWGAPFAA